MVRSSRKTTSLGVTFPLIFAVALAAACDQDSVDGGGDLAITVDTLGGAIRVTNSGTPPEWQLTPVVSIGPQSLDVGSGGPEEFGFVSSAALGPDGAIFVADQQFREVRVFGPDGAHRRTFGRRGEGPGEFSSLYSVAWVGDRLLTLDYGVGRIGEMSAEGEWLGQRNAFRGYSGSPAQLRFYPVGTDEAYVMTLKRDSAGIQQLYVGQGGAGETADTIRVLEGPTTGGITCFFGGGDSVTFFRIPFGPRLVQHPGPGGVLYSALTDDYRIFVTRGADTVRVIERTLPIEGISDEEWEAGNQEFHTFVDETPDESCEPRRPTRPDTKPFIEEIFVAPDGKLWVEVIRTAGNRWEFFDPEGRLLGSVPAPARKERAAPAFGSEHLVTIRQDDLELDHVEVWRIERAGRQ